MALGGVHAGYKNSLYMYQADKNSDLDESFEEWLVELTTELELALEGNMEDNSLNSNEGTDDPPKDGPTEAYSARKKEWEEILEQAKVVEAMLRQALENGLGQQKEEQQKPPKRLKEEELDNEFELEGIPVTVEGTTKPSKESSDFAGNSQFLQTNTGHGAEYFSPGSGSRKYCEKVRTICLTCETDCDQKKQWKITE